MKKDYDILRTLGKKVAEIAALPIQKEKKELWTKNNDLTPERPMVYIDQLPWHELHKTDEMKLMCEDLYLRDIEQSLRETLYRFNHFPCDMVVENYIGIKHNVKNLNYGVKIVEETRSTDERNGVISHKYADQIKCSEDLEKFQYDNITVDVKLDAAQFELLSDVFKDVIPIKFVGEQIHSGVWDRIAQVRPAEAIMWDFADKPELIKATVKKLVDISINTVEQCEKLGLLDNQMQYVHCSGAYTKDLLPVCGEQVKAKNVWSFGMAQLLVTISPFMFEEYEVDLVKPLYEKFGLLYYGCCEPIENKIDIIRKIKNIRKISVSPWANIEKCAEKIGKDYVFSLKSNPTFIANGFDEDGIKNQLKKALSETNKNNSSIEIILKDVSTVSNHLDNIDKWEKLVMEMINSN